MKKNDAFLTALIEPGGIETWLEFPELINWMKL